MTNTFFRSYGIMMAFLALIVIGGSIWYFGIRHYDGVIGADRDEIERLFVERDRQARQVAGLSELERQAAYVDANAQKMPMLVPHDDMVGFIKELEGLAASVGNTIVITEASKDSLAKVVGTTTDTTSNQKDRLVSAPPYPDSILLNVQIGGTYAEIKNFLHKLETMPYILDVVAMSFQALDPSKLDTVSGQGRSGGFGLVGAGTPVPVTDTAATPPAIGPSVSAELGVLVYLTPAT